MIIHIPAGHVVTHYLKKNILSVDSVSENITFFIARDAQLNLWIDMQIAGKYELDCALILEGSGASVVCKGAIKAQASAEIKIRTIQKHTQKQTSSNLLLKAIVQDVARIDHQGLIFIMPQAMQSDAHQKSMILLVGSQARAFAKPDLEVLNNDITCSHGSAIGQLDAEQLFLCQARGISDSQAKNLLEKAFFVDVIPACTSK